MYLSCLHCCISGYEFELQLGKVLALCECNFTVCMANINQRVTVKPEGAADQHQCSAFSGLCDSPRLVQEAFAAGSD